MHQRIKIELIIGMNAHITTYNNLHTLNELSLDNERLYAKANAANLRCSNKKATQGSDEGKFDFESSLFSIKVIGQLKHSYFEQYVIFDMVASVN